MKNPLHLFLLLFLLAQSAEAKIQSAKLAVDVDAGQWKSVRLKNLPRNAAVKIVVRSDGTVLALLISEKQYKQYPSLSRPLFQGSVTGKLNFTVKIPASGNYYLVFDNTAGSRTVKIDAAIAGASGADADLLQSNRGAGQGDSGEKDLASVGRELSAVFIFKPFTLSLRKCAGRDASPGPEKLVLCLEYVKYLSDTLGNQKAAAALLFTLYHEAGHILLGQWNYPFSDHEEIANEFAAMLFAMQGRRDQLTGLMDQLGSGAKKGDLLAGQFKGRLHSLSREQAANILRWVKDDERLREWQKIFVPHMRTAMLERIKRKPPVWADKALVKRELALRKQTVF